MLLNHAWKKKKSLFDSVTINVEVDFKLYYNFFNLQNVMILYWDMKWQNMPVLNSTWLMYTGWPYDREQWVNKMNDKF